MLKELEVQEIEFELMPSLILAMERTELEMKNVKATIKDIATEFRFMNLKDVKTALRNGALSMYGKSYKLSTQEICFWIREYLREKDSKTLKL